MSSKIQVMGIYLHDTFVGSITLLPPDQNMFVFATEYVENTVRPTLSLSFKSAAGGLITEPRISRQKLPPFFSNLLPEGVLRDYLARKAAVHPEKEFFLLAALGRDLPGAIEIRAGNAKDDLASGEFSPRVTENDDVFRFSLAGVQLKFSVIMEASGGLTIPANGVGGSWIVKLPSQTFGLVPQNEFAMMTLAQRSGIDVPEIKLVPVNEVAGLPDELYRQVGEALAVKRFDRGPNGSRIHMEDFAQVFGVYPREKYGKYSYGNLAFVVWAETGERGLEQFVKRMVFSAVIGNADMHLKNWSLLYPDTKSPVLSPAYDLVSTVVYMDDEKLALSVAGVKEMSRLTTQHLRRFAAKARVPESIVLRSAGEIVEAVKANWTELKSQRLLPDKMSQRIEKHMTGVPIFRGE